MKTNYGVALRKAESALKEAFVRYVEVKGEKVCPLCHFGQIKGEKDTCPNCNKVLANWEAIYSHDPDGVDSDGILYRKISSPERIFVEASETYLTREKKLFLKREKKRRGSQSAKLPLLS